MTTRAAKRPRCHGSGPAVCAHPKRTRRSLQTAEETSRQSKFILHSRNSNFYFFENSNKSGSNISLVGGVSGRLKFQKW
ncbi:hypothetical protein GBAR_LOCUS5102 [Geodia barretti]|uniref:Uncharacterized protein n=1 Tax=Geodia barretti TaxID=519541 RepID=A0AA35RB86_GEOBA|nr:hypothetical protein GBAR_LOCUS5102 [Geodia barretti]